MSRNKAQLTLSKCRACGKALSDGRHDRLTCNDACRKRLSRRRAKLRAQSKIVRKALNMLVDASNDELFGRMAVSQLGVIRAASNDAYNRSQIGRGEG
jgi:predicted nucleic acid-binding Zn ribbon protein